MHVPEPELAAEREALETSAGNPTGRCARGTASSSIIVDLHRTFSRLALRTNPCGKISVSGANVAACASRTRRALGLVHSMQQSQSRSLPAIGCSPITPDGRAPPQMLQREYGLSDLAPECRLVAAKSFENSVIEVGQTKKAARELLSTRIATGLEDVDNLAHFSG